MHCHEMDELNERLQEQLLELQVEHDFKERELRENSMASGPVASEAPWPWVRETVRTLPGAQAPSSSAAAVGARFEDTLSWQPITDELISMLKPLVPEDAATDSAWATTTVMAAGNAEVDEAQ